MLDGFTSHAKDGADRDTQVRSAGPREQPADTRFGVGALFQLLRDGRPRTRAELAGETGLARSTIAQRVDALLATGLIGAADKAASSGGRPPTRFAFNPSARAVLAADVGASHVRLAVTDLAGELVAETGEELPVSAGPERVLGWVAEHATELIREAGRRPADLVGVGVGLPGPVEHSTGRPISPPIMPGWDGFDVTGYLTERLGTVVLVDNDVNIMALGEHFTNWPDASQLMFVKVATGIGCGLITDGRLHRGAQGAAGDLGHVQVPRSAADPASAAIAAEALCRCGNVGCLEAVASGAAIAAALRRRGLTAENSGDVVALARGGALEALQLLRQAGRDIGDVLAAAVSLFNPSVIVIGGALSQAGEHLLAGVREVVYQRSLPLATQHLRIVQSRTGERAGIIGAAVMVIDHALSPAEVNALAHAGLQ
ncbi:ROK family transcriptional regulator [Phytoactinopolyspora halotolerans]|uniref:ROK family transcriptional regulator n=1 Tax=Phytoactinopolyspora halotolerans TaxID=1981512 RepID=A0A6L9S9U6_9ACTN|nr:ROK family transcriptional regulator [Phytoactinopolyspora halotolerans]NEE00730.1 ROK family transcriptional regulator [Phytoactinopolyspora halotolerans]